VNVDPTSVEEDDDGDNGECLLFCVLCLLPVLSFRDRERSGEKRGRVRCVRWGFAVVSVIVRLRIGSSCFA
jgi:hypothetical protein